MADAPASREQRLAAKLRENLRRRKQQARARTAADGVPGAGSGQPDDDTTDAADPSAAGHEPPGEG